MLLADASSDIANLIDIGSFGSLVPVECARSWRSFRRDWTLAVVVQDLSTGRVVVKAHLLVLSLVVVCDISRVSPAWPDRAGAPGRARPVNAIARRGRLS